MDWIALSFVRTADEVMDLRGFIRELAPFGRPTPIIPKIEKPEAVEHIDDIIAASDGIMVARGDLGIETSPEEVPMVQKQIIRKCNQAGKPVITATQMLDSMIRNPRPTRAEASDVANAILDGSDAIMLSGETAAGKYPVLAVQTMARIARQVEEVMVSSSLHDVAAVPGRTVGEAVAHAAVETAIDLNAAAIIASTVTGRTARTISRFRPTSPIVALTPNPITQRELILFWGVYPILAQRAHTSEEIVVDCIDAAQKHGYAAEGDVVIVTAGSGGSGGSTNLMRVHQIERVLAHGTGLGEQVVRGRVRRLEGPVPADTRVAPDEIVVTTCTDKTFVPVLRRAAGLISASGGPDAHCHTLALELGIPAVVGVEDGIDSLPDGEEVTLNARRGEVYSRRLP